MGELNIRPPLLLKDQSESDPMAERLTEMYREWCRSRGFVPSSKRQRPQRLSLFFP